ncbi:MAG: hypothetical protein QXG00_06650 [Candidatus Woesearchaeota archaeon]
MPSAQSKVDLDNIMVFLFIKKLMTPINQTKAYQLKLVNEAGRLIKVPTTNEEKQALTLLDRFIFKVKRLLADKLTQLNNFMYIQTMNNDFYNRIVVNGSINQRAEIQRIEKDLNYLQEKYDCKLEDILSLLITEELKRN